METRESYRTLAANTLAFTICFACWTLNGVLMTYLVDSRVYLWNKATLGWLIGIPVLTGSILRLPVGILTDKYGGKPVYACLMLIAAIPMFLLSMADTLQEFMLCSLGFGLAGASFAVGIAYSSLWFSKAHQGTALGIFGAGNAGAAVTSLGAPQILRALTQSGEHLEGWRALPKIYAAALVVMTIVFWLMATPRRVVGGESKTMAQRLAPLKHVRVWRFGLYYFLVFGAFVALAQWLIPYYLNVYGMTVATAGMMAAIFSLPSGIVRALGGWVSDKFGARSSMYWVLGGCLVGCLLLTVPQMTITSPGEGVMAIRAGTVTEVTPTLIKVDDHEYPVTARTEQAIEETAFLPWPLSSAWHEARVAVGDKVVKRQLLAKGITSVYFQANLTIFTSLVFLVGILMGIGKAAVYKHIPEYFPQDVGVVGGIVGVIGGLGGFFCPILFGYLLDWTGIWTTCWAFLAFVGLICLVWMHVVVQGMIRAAAPETYHRIEDEAAALGLQPEPAS